MVSLLLIKKKKNRVKGTEDKEYRYGEALFHIGSGKIAEEADA